MGLNIEPSFLSTTTTYTTQEELPNNARKSLLFKNKQTDNNHQAPDGNIYKARFEELNAKKKLTPEEKNELEILTKVNEITGRNFDSMGEFSTDAENSTIALMQKDEQFLKEAKIDRKQAEENWLKAQFKDLDLNNEEDFPEIKDRMSKLWNNCASPEEKRLLAGIVKRTKCEYFKQIHDDQEAVWETVHAALNGDSKDQIETTRKVSEASRKKRISEETAVNIASAVPEIFKKEVRAEAARILNESGIEEVTKVICQGIQDGKYTREDVDAILKDVLNNPSLTEEQKRDLSRMIGFGIAAKQLELHKQHAEYYAKNQDVKGMDATAEGIRYYEAEYQAPAAETHFNATLMLENPEDRENAQLTLTNQIEYFDASAQAEAHRIVCQSEFESVLIKAAGNICKYDESAQNDALKYTIATGNEEAIKTAVETAEKCKAQSTSSKYYDSKFAAVIEDLRSQLLANQIEEVKLIANLYKVYLENLQENSENTSSDNKKPTSEEEFYAKLEKVATTYNKYQIIKNQDNKKEKMEEWITSDKRILPELVKMGFGPELMAILGENSKYAEEIIELMEKYHQNYKLQALINNDHDLEEMYYDNNPNYSTAQTVPIGSTNIYDISDIKDKYLLNGNNQETDYLLA